MDFNQIKKRAVEIKQKYSEFELKEYGRKWTRDEIAEGLVSDVGDLMKLIMAKKGIRKIDNVDEKFAHELSDCLWAVLILADQYNIDLEKFFMDTMTELDKKISKHG